MKIERYYCEAKLNGQDKFFPKVELLNWLISSQRSNDLAED